MDFLHFDSVSFQPDTNIGQLCEELIKIVGQGIHWYYDNFKIRNTKWLWLVNYVVAVINSEKFLCGCFELFPSYVAGVLYSVKDISFCVLCNKKLNDADCIKQCISEKVHYFAYGKLFPVNVW
jgi:hypothetical protein